MPVAREGDGLRLSIDASLAWLNQAEERRQTSAHIVALVPWSALALRGFHLPGGIVSASRDGRVDPIDPDDASLTGLALSQLGGIFCSGCFSTEVAGETRVEAHRIVECHGGEMFVFGATDVVYCHLDGLCLGGGGRTTALAVSVLGSGRLMTLVKPGARAAMAWRGDGLGRMLFPTNFGREPGDPLGKAEQAIRSIEVAVETDEGHARISATGDLHPLTAEHQRRFAHRLCEYRYSNELPASRSTFAVRASLPLAALRLRLDPLRNPRPDEG